MSDKSVDIQEVTATLVDEEGFDPAKAQQVAAEYRDLVVFEGFEEDVAMGIAKKAVEDQYKEEDRPAEDFQDFNSDASIHAERVARRGADKYRDELDVGSVDFVETAKEEIVNVEETAEETNWEEVERELEMRLRNRLMREDVKAEVRNVIYDHANYDYTESEVNQFANEIIDTVAQDEAKQIANNLVREMETGDIEEEEQTIRESMGEMFARESIKGVAAGLGQKISTTGLKAIGSLLGSAVAGALVL